LLSSRFCMGWKDCGAVQCGNFCYQLFVFAGLRQFENPWAERVAL